MKYFAKLARLMQGNAERCKFSVFYCFRDFANGEAPFKRAFSTRSLTLWQLKTFLVLTNSGKKANFKT